MTIDVLIPTFHRPAALAVTLTSLALQNFRDFRVVISDQSEYEPAESHGEVQAAMNVLLAHDNPVEIIQHLPRRGMAEQRHFLLNQVQADYALFLDDDLILETYVLGALLRAIREEDCGFVGSAVIGLSYRNEIRPEEQAIEFWDGPVQPELVFLESNEWQRHRLHNAANLYHVQTRSGIRPEKPKKYRIAWVGGCVLYDKEKLRDCGGFEFWKQLPPVHSGEDVLAQLRVMAEYGGCGLIPSGVYHQELLTTIQDRSVDAPRVIDLIPSTQEALHDRG